MASSYSVADAKRHLSELLSRVAYGSETIVITKRGRPIARIVPMQTGRVSRADQQEGAPENDPLLEAVGCISPEVDRAPTDLAARHDDYLYGDRE